MIKITKTPEVIKYKYRTLGEPVCPNNFDLPALGIWQDVEEVIGHTVTFTMNRWEISITYKRRKSLLLYQLGYRNGN